jgi:hypothetical protein
MDHAVLEEPFRLSRLAGARSPLMESRTRSNFFDFGALCYLRMRMRSMECDLTEIYALSLDPELDLDAVRFGQLVTLTTGLSLVLISRLIVLLW